MKKRKIILNYLFFYLSKVHFNKVYANIYIKYMQIILQICILTDIINIFLNLNVLYKF